MTPPDIATTMILSFAAFFVAALAVLGAVEAGARGLAWVRKQLQKEQRA